MVTEPTPVALQSPAQDGRTLALLAHLLQAFTGFFAPLIIYIVKHDSRFVRFHALQALLWQIFYMALFFGSLIVMFCVLFLTVVNNPSAPHSQGPPPSFFVFFPFMWLLGFGGWALNLILGIVYGVKSNRGEWATYPVFGKWPLRRIARDAQVPVQS